MSKSERQKWAVARRLLELRAERDLTQRQLGKKVGVSGTCVQNWEGGRSYPRPTALAKLAAALGTTIEYLTAEESVSAGEQQPASAAEHAFAGSLPDLILECRRKIAAVAGIDVSKVRVIFDWGD